MQYRNLQLIKPNGRVRFSRNGNRIDQWSPVLWTQQPFYSERFWRRSTNFGHGHYRYICKQSQLLAVEVRSRSYKQFFWGALSFKFVVLNYLRTGAPSYWVINIHWLCVSCHCVYFSGIYHFQLRVVCCFSLGIETHARDVVYMQWFVVDFMNY